MSRLARNVASNYVFLGANAAYIALLTPLVITHLGARVFGGWALILAIVGYLRLIEVGVGPTTARFVAGARDFEEFNRIVATSTALLSVAGGMAALAASVVAVSVHPRGVPGFTGALLVIAVSRAIQLPLTVAGHVLYGLERLVERNAFQTSRTLAGMLSITLAVVAGGGLLAFSVAGAIAELTVTVGQAAYCLRAVGGLAPATQHVDTKTARRLMSFGIGVFILGMATQIIVYSDTIVVAAALGTGAVAVYAVAMRIVEAANLFLSQISDAFMPVFARLHAVAQTFRSRDMVLQGTRVTAALAFSIVGLLIAFGRSIIELWVGQGFSAAYVPLLLLSAGVAFNAPLRFAVLWAVASARHRRVAVLAAVEAAVNLALTLALVGPLGLSGVALASCVTFTAFNGLVIPWVIARELGVAYGRAFAKPLARAAIVTIPPAILVERLLAPHVPDSLPAVVLGSAAWLALTLVVVSFVVLGADERRRLLNLARSLKVHRPTRIA